MTCYLKYLTLLFLFGILNSCSSDEKAKQEYSDMARLNIKLKTLDADVNIRIIITDAETEDILVNDGNLDLSDTYRTKVKTGTLNIYVIGNEPSRLTPILSNLKHESNLPSITLLRGELPSKEDPSNSTSNTNLPLIRKIPILLKVENNDPETGMVSTDDGKTWHPTLAIELQRLAVKTHLRMRKNTPEPTDKVVIKKVRISHIPAYSYWLPKTYTESDFLPPEDAYDDDGDKISFIQNDDINQDDNFTVIFEDFILPEYLATDDTNKDLAVVMDIYTHYNDAQRIYHIPLQTRPGANTYSLERNTEHTISATIVSEGEIVVSPELGYKVSEWGDAKNEIEEGGVITYDAKWAENTPITGNNVLLASDKVLEFKFKLTGPKGSIWRATLTNPLYFEFDHSNGAVSAGLGGTEMERTIRIKPRKSVNVNGIQTDFYITVDNGTSYVELDLPNGIVGAGNRYVISLIPD